MIILPQPIVRLVKRRPPRQTAGLPLAKREALSAPPKVGLGIESPEGFCRLLHGKDQGITRGT